MLDRIFKKSEWVPAKKYAAQKDIAVRIVCPSEKPQTAPFSEVEIAKDYEQETKLVKPLNVAQCLAVGAAIGLLLCAAASIVGLKLTFGDMAAIIGVPAVFGLLAAYLIF
jgi:hypothetical protein